MSGLVGRRATPDTCFRGPRYRAAAAALVAAAAVTACGGEGGPAVARPPTSTAPPPACVEAGPAPAEDAAPAPPAGGARMLPDVTLPCLGDGDAVPLRALTGTPTVVNLWASWCAPCREELPAFARLHLAGGDRVRVLGIATQDRLAAAEAYAADSGLPFPSLLDPDGTVMRALGRPRLPLTALVDAGGRVVELYQGAPLTDAALRGLVRERLGVDVG